MTPAQILHVDAAHHTATITLVAAANARNNGFNFDGYSRGELLIDIPRGWRVRVAFRNAGNRRVSCAVVDGPLATRPAFRGASTSDPVGGLPPGGRASFSFTASKAGTYRVASVVPGQMQARMYDVLEVTHSGWPSVSVRPGP